MHSLKQKLLQQLRVSFPTLTWKFAKCITRGFDHDVLILDDSLVFRFPKNAYSKKLLKGEVALLKILGRSLNISVPEYTYVAKDFSCAGYAMIVGERLTLKKYRSLSKLQKNTLTKELASFLMKIHSVSLSQIKHLAIRERHAPTELKKLYNDAKKYLYSKLATHEKDNVEDFFANLECAFKAEYSPVLVHGDFSGDNIVIDENGRLVGVIDFTDRAIHDPAFDFVYLWRVFGRELVEAVCFNYKSESSGMVERGRVYAQASALWNVIEATKKKSPEAKKWMKRFKALIPCKN